MGIQQGNLAHELFNVLADAGRAYGTVGPGLADAVQKLHIVAGQLVDMVFQDRNTKILCGIAPDDILCQGAACRRAAGAARSRGCPAPEPRQQKRRGHEQSRLEFAYD